MDKSMYPDRSQAIEKAAGLLLAAAAGAVLTVLWSASPAPEETRAPSDAGGAAARLSLLEAQARGWSQQPARDGTACRGQRACSQEQLEAQTEAPPVFEITGP